MNNKPIQYLLVGGADVCSILYVLAVAGVCGVLTLVGLILLAKGMGA